MADNKTPQMRSWNMAQIKGKNTRPEDMVRKFLFSKGFRYRKNDPRLPGKPDIVLPKYRTVVFVNGCFWHMHNCGRFRWPATNVEYWGPKITHNVERDKRNTELLRQAGWKVLSVWECELKKSVFEETMNKLISKITGLQE